MIPQRHLILCKMTMCKSAQVMPYCQVIAVDVDLQIGDPQLRKSHCLITVGDEGGHLIISHQSPTCHLSTSQHNHPVQLYYNLDDNLLGPLKIFPAVEQCPCIVILCQCGGTDTSDSVDTAKLCNKSEMRDGISPAATTTQLDSPTSSFSLWSHRWVLPNS